MDKQFSNRIYWLRLVCATMVVGLHCKNADILGIPENSWSIITQDILRHYVYCIAVPFFFVISAFFFYYNVTDANFIKKWKLRLKRTIYLYLFWNIVYTLYRLVKSNISILSGLGRNHSATPITYSNILKGIFLHEYNQVWWFMLQLVLLELIAPIIWRLIKNRYLFYVFFLVVMLLATCKERSILANSHLVIYTFVYYFLGVGIARFHSDLIIKKSKEKLRVGIILLLISELLLVLCRVQNLQFLEWLPICILTMGCMLISCELVFKKECNEDWRISFFIFATHPFLIGLIYEVEKRVFPINDVTSFLCFLINPIVIVFISKYCVIILKKMKIYPLLSGGFIK